MRRTIACAVALIVLSVIGSAQRADPTDQEKIGTVQQIYDGRLTPDLQASTFRHIDRLFPTRTVKHSSSVFPLPTMRRNIETVSFKVGNNQYDLFDYLSFDRVSGFLVIKNGAIAYEDYELGNTPQTRWMSMSMAKTITGTLIGAAVKDGHIKSIDDPLTQYLPQLRGGGYDGVTIRNLMQMTSGVKWDETYTDPKSDRRHMLDLQIAQKPGAILQFMTSLPRAAPPGTRWSYSTGETQVAAALVRAAVGKPLSDYLSERVWAPFGMEDDATWWLDSPNGTEIGGSGLSSRLRDYGRFGLFLLSGGKAGGEQILPDGWVTEAGSPKTVGGSIVNYGYLTWPVPDSAGTIHEGAFEARGAFGQHIYVNPRENVVIVIWSAFPKPVSVPPVDDVAFLTAVVNAVR